MVLEDQVALVTGAGRGIGKAIACALAAEGARVMVTDIDEEQAALSAGEIERDGGKARSFRIDVSDSSAIDAVLGEIITEFNRVDILVNNAGINIPTPFLELAEETWDRIVEVNLKGVFLCSKAAAKEMVKLRSGKIINIASVAGKIGAPGLGPYCASKRGVIGLTEVMSIELGPYGICVNAICPGNIESEMNRSALEQRAKMRGKTLEEMAQCIREKTPLGRFGDPMEIGELVVFLASSHSNFITGQAISICGGRSVNLS